MRTQTVNSWKEKLEHIWTYYKWYGFLFIFLGFIAVNLVMGVVADRRRHITIVVGGDFFSPRDMEAIIDRLKPEDVHHRNVDRFNLYADPANLRFYMDLIARYQAMLLARELDIGIFTEDYFTRMYRDNFRPLRVYALPDFSPEIGFFCDYGELFGIRLPVLVGIRDDMIVGVYFNTRKIDNAYNILHNVIAAWD